MYSLENVQNNYEYNKSTSNKQKYIKYNRLYKLFFANFYIIIYTYINMYILFLNASFFSYKKYCFLHFTFFNVSEIWDGAINNK